LETETLQRAKKFLARNAVKLALRAAPLALVAAGIAHANPTFSAPNSTSVTQNCSGGSLTGSLAGAATNNGLGETLSGSASLGISNSTCAVTMKWKGNGSGTFVGSTAALNSNFNITPPNNGSVQSWVMTVFINGSQVGQFSCAALISQANSKAAPRIGTLCSGAQSLSNKTVTVPASFSNWEVDLVVTGFFGSGDTMSISVPSGASIDLLAAGTTGVPALTPASLFTTAMLLLGLAAYKLFGWTPSRRRPY